MEDESKSVRISLGSLVPIVLLVGMFTATLIIQCFGLFYQWTTQRMVLTVLIAQSPTQELEGLLQKYFYPPKTMLTNNEPQQPKKHRKGGE